MIKILATCGLALLLSACASKMPYTASYQINATAYGPGNRMIYQTDGSPTCIADKGGWLGSFFNRVLESEQRIQCVIQPEGEIPDQITIEYAQWMDWEKQFQGNYYLRDLPDEALLDLTWHKITLHRLC